MARREKIIARFVQNPTGLAFREIEKILFRLGFEAIPAKGSHKKFKHPLLKMDIIIPVHNGECKNFYKREILTKLKNNNLLKPQNQTSTRKRHGKENKTHPYGQ